MHHGTYSKYGLSFKYVGPDHLVLCSNQALADNHDCVRNVRVKGLFAAVDLVDNKGNRISPLQVRDPHNMDYPPTRWP